MCGIVAYAGTADASALLIEGLRSLEYRGYDSAGIAVGGIGITKAVGPIKNLASKVATTGGTIGIAHTRWATHGEPTEVNAHPHRDASGKIALVHNGIIENFRDIKDELTLFGHVFASDTDTEVLAHLIGREYETVKNLHEAVGRALRKVRGTYGIAVMHEDESETIVVARFGSPLVIGIAPHGHLVASDPCALIAHTKEVVYLEDGDIARVTKDAYHVVSPERGIRSPIPERIDWDVEEAEKGGYEHFMVKEIMEGPDVLRNSMRGRVRSADGMVKLGGLEMCVSKLRDARRITIVGCGSAYYTGLAAEYMLETYARIPVDVELASEFRYRNPVIEEGHIVLAVSQSGETADTLAAVREGKRLGAFTLGVVNVVGSTIARETDAGIYNHAGPEAGVASTKAFLSQLLVFALFTVHLGRLRGTLSDAERKEITRAIEDLPSQIERILSSGDDIASLAHEYAFARDFLFIGRTSHMPIAYEGALKLKEVSYVHAEGYGAGEMKHGPIAMIDESFPTVALMPDNDVFEKMVSNVEEIRARRGPVIAVTTEGSHVAHVADAVITIPRTHDLLQPILSTVPLQLFAYHFGVGKGYNVDRPRNLAKSVTVE